MPKTKVPGTSAKLRAWRSAVGELLKTIETWSAEQHWLVHRERKQIQEREFGDYELDVLTIQSPAHGRLVVEPIASRVAGGEGRVDLYAWPSLNRVWLLLRNGKWVVRTESGIDWPQPWGRKTFLNLAKALMAS